MQSLKSHFNIFNIYIFINIFPWNLNVSLGDKYTQQYNKVSRSIFDSSEHIRGFKF